MSLVIVGTHDIAKMFNKEHRKVKHLVEKHKEMFEVFGEIEECKLSGKTKNFNSYLLNHEQLLFLITLFRNTKDVVEGKINIIKMIANYKNDFLDNYGSDILERFDKIAEKQNKEA